MVTTGTPLELCRSEALCFSRVPSAEAAPLAALEKIIQGDDVAVFIFEPLVLGSGGMIMYSPEVLDKMVAMCQAHGVLCLADEVMTGFGRTGKFFASNYLENQPDIFAFSKGLTGGTLPMSITSCSEKVFNAFLSDDKNKTFYHGHSYTGNPVGCAAALASVDLLVKEETWDNIHRIIAKHTAFRQKITHHPATLEVRQQGTILAVEIKTGASSSYFNNIRDKINAIFMREKVLLRPLGNVVYVLPPYCITNEQLDRVYEVIELTLDWVQAQA